jgi:hypothetical protein
MVGTSARAWSKSLRLAFAGAATVLAVGGAAILLGACNLLNGSADLATSDGLGNGLSPDGGRLLDGAVVGSGEGGAASDGGGGDGPTTGGGFIDDAGIDPKLKSCGANLICLPDVAGWSPASLQIGAGGGSNGACAMAYPVATAVQTSGGGSCNCTCTASGGSCANGSVADRQGAGCAGAATAIGVTANQCSASPLALPLPIAFVATSNDPAPTSCGATVDPQLKGPRPVTYCTGAVAVTPPSSGSACAEGEICVNRPNLPFGGLACIVHDGDIACPNRLSYRTVVGTSVADGRSCTSTCSCKPEACAGTLEAFSDAACATSVRKANVDGSCTTAGANMTGSSFRYTPSLGCGVSVAAKVLGSETYTAPRTLCCTFG